ncbi:thioredoxin family protein [Cribrihabitans neustonicus]|uniref:thioredoxin family protein n=1 Tax=Cribrihabitans neustonicus TaxID=1429085 RepID=UPI003B5D0384
MVRLAPLLAGAALALTFAAAPVRAELELVMVELEGCAWCKRWNAEIAPIYPKTEEGAAAPLRRVDLHDMPAGLTLAREVRAAPTFLLVEDGVETGRIEGYPGEAFFWGLLQKLLAERAAAAAAPQD